MTEIERLAAAFLDEMADRLDGWARESRTGGWSTHQVKDNKRAANDCRRMAATIRQGISEQSGLSDWRESIFVALGT